MKRKYFFIISFICLSFVSCWDRTDQQQIVDDQNTVYSESPKVVEQSQIDTMITVLPSAPTETEEWILYPLEMNGKYGFINQFGDLIVEPQFHRALKSECGVASAEKDDIMYYIDVNDGSILFTADARGRMPDSFSDDLLVKYVEINGESIGGYVDKTGEWVIPPMYDTVYDFSEGLANVLDMNGERYYINKENIRVFGEQNYWGDLFHNGYAFVRKKLIDDFLVDRFDHGVSYQEWIDGTFGGIINNKGELVIPYVLAVNAIYSDGLFSTRYRNIDNEINGKSTGKNIYINEHNEVILELEDFRSAYDFVDGIAVASIENNDGEKYGLINKQGEFVVQPSYVDLRFKSNGVYLFSKDGLKYGYIDEKANVIIPPDFDFANSFEGPLAFIKKGNIPGYVNREGKVFLATDYEVEDVLTINGK